MARRRDVLEALVWLTRWLGGRRERLMDRISVHEAKIVDRLLVENEMTTDGEACVQLYGFSLTIVFGDEGVSILSIEPPEMINGHQMDLFDDEDDNEQLLE